MPDIKRSRLPIVDALNDTDVILAPVSSGLEVMAQLRSAKSPEDVSLDLDLPAGTRIELTDEGTAGFFLDAEQIGRITAPFAIDAQSQVVESRLEVRNGSVSVVTEHQGEDVAYPILLDPIVENYQQNSSGATWNWLSGRTDGLNDWNFIPSPPGNPHICDFSNFKYGGLGVQALNNTECLYGPNSWGHWLYDPAGGPYVTVPRTDFGPIGMAIDENTAPPNTEQCKYYEPHAYVGVYNRHIMSWAGGNGVGLKIFSPGTGGTPLGPVGGSSAYTINPGHANAGDIAVAGMGVDANWRGLPPGCRRTFHMGGAKVYLSDTTTPAVSISAGAQGPTDASGNPNPNVGWPSRDQIPPGWQSRSNLRRPRTFALDRAPWHVSGGGR